MGLSSRRRRQLYARDLPQLKARLAIKSYPSRPPRVHQAVIDLDTTILTCPVSLRPFRETVINKRSSKAYWDRKMQSFAKMLLIACLLSGCDHDRTLVRNDLLSCPSWILGRLIRPTT